MLNTRLKLESKFIAGLNTNKISIVKSDSKGNNKLTVELLSLYRTNDNYLIIDGWEENRMNNRIDINLEHKYNYGFGKGEIKLEIQTSALGSYYDYNKIILSILNNNKLQKLKIKTRTYMQIGNGSNWAEESKLGLSGANNEEMMDSKFTRSQGIVTSENIRYNNNIDHFHAAGGLNLRGYAGYIAPEYNANGTISSLNYNGKSGAALNTEIDFTAYLPNLIRKYNVASYVFADAGIISNQDLKRTNFTDVFTLMRTDAGIGFTYTIKEFGSLENIKPLTIRLDMPLFLNRNIGDDTNAIKMRWLVGINRAF